MRTLAFITTAIVGLGFATASFAQSSQSAPQPGLPPGAGYGAVNAQPPSTTGLITTTPTGGTVAPAPSASQAAPAPRRHYTYRVRRAHHRARHTTATTTTTTTPAQ